MKNIFITGTTGFLGSYFLYHVLQHSEDNIICLARDTPLLSASSRVLQQLYKIHQTYCKVEIGDNDLENKIQKRLQVLSGDITSKNLGLTKQFERGSIHELWHIAANVQFGDSAKEEIIQVNLEGGKNVVQFAKQNGIETVNYISTAYVAGQKTGPVNETENFDLFPSNNIYEESKRLMEKEIISANKNNILSFRIFRPSIIAGHSKTYEPDFSNGGLYGFLALTNSLKKSFESNHHGYFKKNFIKLYANRFSTLNIVPIDQVVKTLFNIANCPDSLNKIFHVVSENNTTLNEVALLINQFTGLQFEFVTTTENFQAIDHLFARKLNKYNCYLTFGKHFKTDNIRSVSPNDFQYHLGDKMLFNLMKNFYGVKPTRSAAISNGPF